MRRCKVCGIPYGWPVVGWMLRSAMGVRQYSKNPNLCNRCAELAPLGGEKIDVSVLFADIRGFTRLSEALPLETVRSLLNGYFQLAIDVFIRHDAIVDKFLGDGTMAVFGAPIARPDHAVQAVEAAVELQQGIRELLAGEGRQTVLAVGIGINTGEALVGNVGSGQVKDWTAIGDMVNVAARLQGLAEAGEVLLTEAVYRQTSPSYPSLEKQTLRLDGRTEPVVAYRLRP